MHLCRFKDADGCPLEEYAIGLQVEDGTAMCSATLVHQAILEHVGVCRLALCTLLSIWLAQVQPAGLGRPLRRHAERAQM
jgi:hypothetical protein